MLRPLVLPLLLLLLLATADSIAAATSAPSPNRLRRAQELRAYAAARGILPQGQGSNMGDDDDAIPPRYESIHPNQIANMGVGSDALLNPQGIAGMGPGAVAMGVRAKDAVHGGGGEG